MNILYCTIPLFSLGTDGGAWLPGTLEVIDASTYFIRKPNGKVLSIQPDGSQEERNSVGGSYETFSWPDKPLNVLAVTPRDVMYKFAIREQ